MLDNRKTILIVDDEIKIVEVIKSYLENSGYTVFTAHNGNTALELFKSVNPDLLILDLMLPDVSGEDICKTIRKTSKVPIIMLTAKVEEEHILNGLDIGADDYITKPFSPKQLLARVAAILRRTNTDNIISTNNISFNNDELTINNLSYEVFKNGNRINLTPNEYKILTTLTSYINKVFTREELLTAIDEECDVYDRTIDAHIKNLRHKIEPNPKEPKYILTVHGVGYKFGGE